MTTNTERDSVTAEQALILEALDRIVDNAGLASDLNDIRAFIRSARAAQPSVSAAEVTEDRPSFDPVPTNPEFAAFLSAYREQNDGSEPIVDCCDGFADPFAAAMWQGWYAKALSAQSPAPSAAEVRAQALADAERACEVLACSDEVNTPADCVHAIRALAAQSPTQTAAEGDGLAPLLTVLKLADELCDSVDAASEDIGGHRSAMTILAELGPAVDKANCLVAAQQEGKS